MPKLDAATYRACGEYHDLRYSHWSDVDRENRRAATVRQLKKLSPERQAKYRADVALFMEKNGHLLVQIEQARKQIEDNARTNALLQVPEQRRDALLVKHGGNVNAVLREICGRHH